MKALKQLKQLKKNLINFLEGEKTMMAIFLANNIIRGRITFSKVPKYYKKAVAEQLRLADAEDLITEKGY